MTLTDLRQRLSANACSEQDVTRWDREWLKYLSTESPRWHFQSHASFGKPNDVRALQGAAMWGAELFSGVGASNLWLPGKLLDGARVLEIGCGCGFLGRQLGLVGKDYVGIDHSRFALYVARLTSPPNCHFLHSTDADGLANFARSRDFMVGRHFFIHQNAATAARVLTTAGALLREGGRVYADFFLPPAERGEARIYRASDPIDAAAASAGYEFTHADIERLARATGFTVQSVEDAPGICRRFAVLELRKL